MPSFTILESFGLFGVGFLWLRFADYLLGTQIASNASPGPADAVFVFLVSYIVGSIDSSIAEFLIERSLVNRAFGRPEDVLLESGNVSRQFRMLFPGYFTGLPPNLRNRLVEEMIRRTIPTDAQSRFHHARQVAKCDDRTWAKLETFLGLFVFSRNLAFALLVMGLIALAASLFGTTSYLLLGVLCVLGSVGMLYRYLKFYRQYSFELFCAYPDIVARSEGGGNSA